jgi:hypothetical protein
MIRWRVEIAVILLGAALWRWTGARGLWTAAGLLACAAAIGPVRRVLLGVARAVVVCHRVRSALLQAGVLDRAGGLPWLVLAWPSGTGVKVLVWLGSGTTADDVRSALPLVRAATGAVEADIDQSPLGPDRMVLTVDRPRGGRPSTSR